MGEEGRRETQEGRDTCIFIANSFNYKEENNTRF